MTPTGSVVNLTSVPVLENYAPYYSKISGAHGTFVYSGPNIKQDIPEVTSKKGIFNYQGGRRGPGALDHASQPNERLAIVTFSATHYLFSYTCKERVPGFRECDVDTNQLRALIDKLFALMDAGKSLSQATQAVNLDGGPSIYMSWSSGTTEQKYPRGNKGGKTSDPDYRGRKVETMIMGTGYNRCSEKELRITRVELN